ncbi:MAG: hypothetical protein U0441_18310 [Polyangiaceae bacterium]
MSRAWGPLGCALCLISVTAGCGGGESSSSSAGGTTTTTGTTSDTGGGGTGGDTGGSTGGSTGGGEPCTPGEKQSCYSGPAGTQGVGACKAGERQCKANGEGFGPCTGEVLPADETCATPVDDNCDGQVNEGGADCVCVPGAMMDCYSGPSGTAGVGDCKKGQQTCNADGLGYGPCDGEVVPATETCMAPGDEDCDGLVNEDGAGCSCTPGATQPCYSGPAGTAGVGACKAGVQICNVDGTGWGACEGEVLPVVETCATPEDDNCNGQVNEEGAGCTCVPNSVGACYTGPAGTVGVGLCKAGTATCNAQGTGYGPCAGDVTPVAETCMTPGDDNCNGQVNESGPGCVCVPGTIQTCYDGPAGTLGVGICAAGTQTCAADGLSWGACAGQVLPQPENCATPIDEDCDVTPDCGGVGWAVGFGMVGQQQGFGIATDAIGNAYVAGGFTGQLPVGGSGVPPLVSQGGSDAFLIKLDPAGLPVWYKSYGSASIYEQASSIVTDAQGNLIVAGYFDGSVNFGGGALTTAGNLDIFVAKLDPQGNQMWAKRFGDAASQYAVDVAVDGSGNVFLLTRGFGTTDFGGGGLTSAGTFDVYLAKLNANGAFQWAKRFGGPMDDDAAAVTVDGTGNVIITGSMSEALDFGGGAVNTQGGFDVYVAKFNTNGTLQWSKRYGDAANQLAVDIDADAAGNLFVGGGFEGNINFGPGAMTAVSATDSFLAKLDANGNGMLSKRWGVVGSEIASYAVKASPTGDVFFGGAITGAMDFGKGALPAGGGADVFLLRLDPTLSPVWTYRYGAAQNQYPKSLAVHAMGDLFVTGYFEGNMTIGASNLMSQGVFDVWAARLTP